jgi:hypothetical protein
MPREEKTMYRQDDVKVPVEQPPREAAEAQAPDYEAPRVVTYRGEQIQELLRPAQACSFNHSVLLC